jgi:hypothetical protein
LLKKRTPSVSFAPEKGDKSHLPLIGGGTLYVQRKKLPPQKRGRWTDPCKRDGTEGGKITKMPKLTETLSNEVKKTT